MIRKLIWVLGLCAIGHGARGEILFQSNFETGAPTYGFVGKYEGNDFREEQTAGWTGMGSRLTVLRGRDQFNLGWYGPTGRNWSAGETIFVRFRIRFDNNWRWDGTGSQQNKIFDLGVGGNGESRVILHEEKPHSTTPCGLPPGFGGGNWGALSLKKGITEQCTAPVPITHSRWHHVQLALRASAPGQSNGFFKLWVDNNNFGQPSSQRTNTTATATHWDGYGFGGFWTDRNNNRDQGFVVDDFQIATDFDANWAQGSESPGGGPPPPQNPPPSLPPAGSTGLPVIMNFETGDFQQFNAAQYSQLPDITSTGCAEGRYCAMARLTAGTHSDFYVNHEFGDIPSVGLDKSEEVYLALDSRISEGYRWPNDTQKIAILNLTDGQSSLRRYQIILVVWEDGRYGVELTDIDDWRFRALNQNRGGTAVGPVATNWDRLKLHVRLNTPGADDGVVRLWVNGVLKLERRNLDIRESTDYGMGRFILSSYATDASGSDGTQWWDNIVLSNSDPDDTSTRTEPPTLSAL